MSFDRPLTQAELAARGSSWRRRSRREPLQYVLGEWGFRRLTLTVDRRALIPRPETEILVERALALIAGRRAAAGARRRHGFGRDRARDRRRASRRRRDGDRQLGRRARARSRERREHRPRGRARSPRPLPGIAGRARGTWSSRTRPTSTRRTCRASSPRFATGSRMRRSPATVRSRRSSRGVGRRARSGRRARGRGGSGPGRRRLQRSSRSSARRGRDHPGSRRDRPGRRRPAAVTEVDEVVRAVRGGELAVLPTDTVYGLVCTAAGREPAADLYRLKGRPAIQPTAVLFAARRRAAPLSARARRARAGDRADSASGPVHARRPEPGRPFAWLTRAAPDRSASGCRFSRALAAVVDRLGAVVATSANLPGGPDPRTLAEVPAEILAGVAAVVDGGELPGVPVDGDRRHGSRSGSSVRVG